MKKATKFLIIIMLIGTIGLLIYRISNGIYYRLPTDLSLFIVLLIPIVLNKYISLSNIDKLVIYIFIFIADFLGCVVNLFKYISWFDTFTHFLSGIFFFFVGLRMLYLFKAYNKNIYLNIIFALGIVFASACIWEIFEFFMDSVFNMNLQHYKDTGVLDTMEDIIACSLGGVLASIIYNKKFNDKLKKI